jgi:hypothetical protein
LFAFLAEADAYTFLIKKFFNAIYRLDCVVTDRIDLKPRFPSCRQEKETHYVFAIGYNFPFPDTNGRAIAFHKRHKSPDHPQVKTKSHGMLISTV